MKVFRGLLETAEQRCISCRPNGVGDWAGQPLVYDLDTDLCAIKALAIAKRLLDRRIMNTINGKISHAALGLLSTPVCLAGITHRCGPAPPIGRVQGSARYTSPQVAQKLDATMAAEDCELPPVRSIALASRQLYLRPSAT
jgi:hypothetical protein